MKKHLQLLTKFCCLWIATFFCNKTLAQNWQPIPNHDTVYFTEPIGDLAVLWIDSARQINTDSIFYFQPSIKLVDPFIIPNSFGLRCIDTLGASFLGNYFIKKEDSIYQLKDIYGDTITLKPFRDIGQPWIYKMDTNQIEIRATITEKSSSIINNELDSVITIQLQAFQLNLPINHELNRQIRLSKFHGFIEVYNLHKIVEDFYFYNSRLPITNMTQLEEKKYLINREDRMKILETNFATGNQFIYKYFEQGIETSSLVYYDMDSIISGTRINDSTFVKHYKYGYYTKNFGLLTQNEVIKIDTIHLGTNHPKNYLHHRYPYWNDVNNSDNLISPFTSTEFSYDTLTKVPSLNISNEKSISYSIDTCFMAGIFFGGWTSEYITLSPFDSVYSFVDYQEGFPGPWYEQSYQRIYSKIGNQITGYNPLPALEFTLQGIHHEERNELYWKTSAEMNTDYFVIERSNYQQEFEEIGQQKAAGNANTLSTYSFIDSEIPSDVNTVLYRIKLVDIDQQVSYSNTITLASNNTQGFSISPNPCYDKLNVHYSTNAEIEIDFTIRNTIGQIVFNKRQHMTPGTFELPINISLQLALGVFFYEFTNLTTQEVFKGKLSKL